MNKVAYNLGLGPNGPGIVKVAYDNPKGVSWREAKKQLRSYYLAQAARLRQITEKEFFNDDPVL